MQLKTSNDQNQTDELTDSGKKYFDSASDYSWAREKAIYTSKSFWYKLIRDSQSSEKKSCWSVEREK